MFAPIDPTQLPNELELPMVAGYPPLVPVLPFAPAIGRPRSLAAVEAGREGGLLAWLVKRDPKGDGAPADLLPVGVICQVGDTYVDDQGRSRTALHAVARCTWSGLQDDGTFRKVTVRPVGMEAAAAPELEPLAIGFILQALVAPDDEMENLLVTAMRDLGGLADEALSGSSSPVPPTRRCSTCTSSWMAGRGSRPWPRSWTSCRWRCSAPPPAIAAVQAQLRGMLASGEPPDLEALMGTFFADVAGEDGEVAPEMVLAFGRMVATTGA